MHILLSEAGLENCCTHEQMHTCAWESIDSKVATTHANTERERERERKAMEETEAKSGVMRA